MAVKITHDLPPEILHRRIEDLSLGMWFSNGLVTWLRIEGGAVEVRSGKVYGLTHFEHMEYVNILDVDIRTRDRLQS